MYPRIRPVNGSVKKILVLGIDVDETLINHDIDTGEHTFNGSPSLWTDYLDKIRSTCSRYGHSLLVQIISAKGSGNVDVTIDMVYTHLKFFLNSIDEHGAYLSRRPENTYDVMFHVNASCLKKRKKIQSDLICQTMPYNPDERILSTIHDDIYKYPEASYPGYSSAKILPPVHICHNNMNDRRGGTSKALVLQHIQNHVNTSSNTIFMLDNSIYVKDDIERTDYKFVSAHALETARTDPEATPKTRALLCENILKKLQKDIQNLFNTMYPNISKKTLPTGNFTHANIRDNSSIDFEDLNNFCSATFRTPPKSPCPEDALAATQKNHSSRPDVTASIISDETDLVTIDLDEESHQPDINNPDKESHQPDANNADKESHQPDIKNGISISHQPDINRLKADDYLHDIHFNNYLTIFEQKAQRRRARLKEPVTEESLARTSQNFYNQLNNAKNTYVNSCKNLTATEEFVTATKKFIAACQDAINSADPILVAGSSTTNFGPCFWQGDRSYRTNRDNLKTALEGLQIKVNTLHTPDQTNTPLLCQAL